MLSLSGTAFQGELPSWMFSFDNLSVLDLLGNNFSGGIPASIFNADSIFARGGDTYILPEDLHPVVVVSIEIPAGKQLTFSYELRSPVLIDLSGNSLSGEIPGGLLSLKGVECLNLSFNLFSGEIPVGLANMSSLRSLDLSHNCFTGQIPPDTPDIQNLTHLNMSYSSLTGSVPEKKRIFSFPGAFVGNPGLCGTGDCPAGSLLVPMTIGESFMSMTAFTVSAVVNFYVLISAFFLCQPAMEARFLKGFPHILLEVMQFFDCESRKITEKSALPFSLVSEHTGGKTGFLTTELEVLDAIPDTSKPSDADERATGVES